MLTESKNAAQSVTFYGLALTLLAVVGPVLAPMLGLEWDFTQEELEEGVASVEQLVTAGAAVLGILTAAWGRLRAKTKVTLL